MTGSIVLGTGAEIKRRMDVDTSNCLALGSWYATDGTTQIATIQYHNTAHRLLLNPLGSTNVWNDVAGNYTLKIGQNELTYNTYAIIHAGNLSSYTATLQSNLGLGSFAYKSSLAFSELSAHPTTLSGYGITDFLVQFNSAATATSDLLTSGIYRFQTCSDFSELTYGNMLVVRGTSSSDTLTQIAMPYNTNNIYFRSGALTTYSSNAWKKLYHTGNLSLATLAGSSAIGSATTPIYYDGSSLVAGAALGGAAYYSATSSVTSGSMALVTSGAVYTGLAGKTNYTFVHFTDLGYTAGDTVDLYDLLVKLYSVYGNTARSIIFDWVYANAGFVTDGTTTVRLVKTLMYIAYNNLTTTTTWCYAHGYLVGDNGEFYTFDCAVGSTAGTTQTKAITYVPSGSYVYANYVNITGAQTISGAKTFSAAAAFSSTLSVSGATTLSSTLSVSGQTTINKQIDIYPGNNSNYAEGLRIHTSDAGWTAIILCGADNTGTTGTSTNSWSLHTYGGNFFVNRNASNATTSYILCNVSGNWGMGTNAPAYKLDVAGTLRATGAAYLNAGLTVTGAITSTGDQSISSDLALKTNLRDIDLSASDIAKTRAVRFDWKDGRGTSVGTIAQDWESLVPEWVHGEDGGKSLSYAQAGLVSAIVIAREVDRHETEIERLRKRVKTLEEEVKRLKTN